MQRCFVAAEHLLFAEHNMCISINMCILILSISAVSVYFFPSDSSRLSELSAIFLMIVLSGIDFLLPWGEKIEFKIFNL